MVKTNTKELFSACQRKGVGASDLRRNLNTDPAQDWLPYGYYFTVFGELVTRDHESSDPLALRRVTGTEERWTRLTRTCTALLYSRARRAKASGRPRVEWGSGDIPGEARRMAARITVLAVGRVEPEVLDRQLRRRCGYVPCSELGRVNTLGRGEAGCGLRRHWRHATSFEPCAAWGPWPCWNGSSGLARRGALSLRDRRNAVRVSREAREAWEVES